MLIQYLLIFLISSFLLVLAGKWLCDSLSKIAKFLGWKEFVVAFFFIAFSVSVPNFFVGIISALNKVPELSFGDVIGGNVVAMTLLVAIGALISKAGLSAPSRTVQTSSMFTLLIAFLPVILAMDNQLGREDGVLLLVCFFVYLFWLFLKRERFSKIYDHISEVPTRKFFFKNLFFLVLAIFLVLASASGVVKSARFFGEYFKINLVLVGIFFVALGNNLPELVFILQAARKSQDWFILGDLIGGVIITSTLVLGVVSLMEPIRIFHSSSLLIARLFLVISALFFFFFVRTDRKITKREALFLLFLYFCFAFLEILVR